MAKQTSWPTPSLPITLPSVKVMAFMIICLSIYVRIIRSCVLLFITIYMYMHYLVLKTSRNAVFLMIIRLDNSLVQYIHSLHGKVLFVGLF